MASKRPRPSRARQLDSPCALARAWRLVYSLWRRSASVCAFSSALLRLPLALGLAFASPLGLAGAMATGSFRFGASGESSTDLLLLLPLLLELDIATQELKQNARLKHIFERNT